MFWRDEAMIIELAKPVVYRRWCSMGAARLDVSLDLYATKIADKEDCGRLEYENAILVK